MSATTHEPEEQEPTQWVCYHCRDGNCDRCVGVPCHCPCEWPKPFQFGDGDGI